MKKFINKKTVVRVVMALALVMIMALPCFATNANDIKTMDDVVSPVVSLINTLLTPVLSIVGAAGTIYCVILGVKYARAEEPQDREKAKQHLKNAIIGFALIFILIVALGRLTPFMIKWMSSNSVK